MNANLEKLLFQVSLVDKLSPQLGPMMTNVDKATGHMKKGFLNVGIGVAGIAGVGFAVEKITRKAIAFESAMSDVNKVVEFSNPTGLKDFSQDILNMSKTIPIAAEGLAQIAASGGQLGLSAIQLPDFVDVTAKMSIAFDMLPDKAGESMAKLSNIYNIPINKMSQLGDAINHLSDNTASKASDIVNVLGRIGGVTTQFGLTATQSSALSSTFLALGTAPEVAGTAINSLLMKLQTADAQGAKFQRTLLGMGINSKILAKDIKGSPQTALSGFLDKLQGLDNQARAVALTNIVGTGFADDISLLVGGLDKYNKALGLVGKQHQFLGSMEKEFQVRSKTTANKIQLMSNRWDRLMINFGSLLLPRVIDSINFLNSVIDPVADKIGRWSKLFPGLAEGVGWLASAIFGGVAAFAAFNLVMGIGSIVAAGFTGVMAVLGAPFVAIPLAIFAVGFALDYLFEKFGIFEAFNKGWVSVQLGVTNFIETTVNAFTGLKSWFKNFNLWEFLFSGVDQFVKMINLIPGVSIDLGSIPNSIPQQLATSFETPKPIPAPAALTQFSRPNIEPGGVTKHLVNTINKSRSSTVGDLHMHNYGQAPNGQQLLDELAFAAG
jgi:TP901 family phage tail tape measure protein